VDSGDYRVDLFGTSLTRIKYGKVETVSTHKALENIDAVAVIFGKFSDPLSFQLIPQIQKALMQKSLPQRREIVFATRDSHSESDFEKMFQHMPWWSIPFKNRYLAEKLSTRFGIKDTTALAIVQLNWQEHRVYLGTQGNALDTIQARDNAMYNAISDFMFVD